MVKIITSVSHVINIKHYIYEPHMTIMNYIHQGKVEIIVKTLKEISKMNQSQNVSHQAGQAAGQAQVSYYYQYVLYTQSCLFNFFVYLFIVWYEIIVGLGERKQHDGQGKQYCTIC